MFSYFKSKHELIWCNNYDKDRLAKELARIHLILKQNGIVEKVRLPGHMIGDPIVMKYFNLSDVVKDDDKSLPYRDNEIDLGKGRSN